MKAAIYARKSNDDGDRTLDNKSVTRQVDNAKKYAAQQGWSVDDDHIFIDDGISGANFTTRPGLLRILSRLKEFDVLIMSELSRLGREQSETSKALAAIYAKDVKIHFYLTNEELNFETAVDKFMVGALAFAAEIEREKAGQRSRDALQRKAAQGYNTGGIVYGYRNIWVANDGTRKPAQPGVAKPEGISHTEYEINEQEAVVICQMFSMYAAGHGMLTIAKTMNGDPKHAAKRDKYFAGQAPPSPRKGTGSWAPSSVRALLHNERYEGRIPFGQHKKVYRQGSPARVKQDDFMMTDAPTLRIVPAKLVKTVRQRQASVKKTYIRSAGGQLWGKPGSGRVSKYLLTGLASCGCCGANITTLGGTVGHGKWRKPAYRYGCSHHHNRGPTVCSNDTKGDMRELDHRVIEAIEQQILTPDAIAYTVQKAMELIVERRRENPDRPAQIQRELRKLDKELNNFMNLISSGNAPDRILTEISDREQRIAMLKQELAELQVQTPAEIDQKWLLKATSERLSRFGDLIRAGCPRRTAGAAQAAGRADAV